MLLRLFILLSVVFSSASFAQPKENRVALVVGNSTYKSAPLRNPTNDAKDMAAKLKGMGFTVIERSNLTVKQIGSTLREFRSKLTPGSVALVFYAGHGVQIKGENYLPAVDADISGLVIPLKYFTLDAAFKRGTRRAGLDDVRFHDLRRTAITRMALKLPNVIELAAVSGHKSLMVLKQYYRPDASELAKKLS